MEMIWELILVNFSFIDEKTEVQECPVAHLQFYKRSVFWIGLTADKSTLKS